MDRMVCLKFYIVGFIDAEQYVMAFHQITGTSSDAAVYLYNPGSASVTYSLTTPNMLTGGINQLNLILNSNTGASTAVSSSLLLDGSGSDKNRGELGRIILKQDYLPSTFSCERNRNQSIRLHHET